jgi:hypothetical protein
MVRMFKLIVQPTNNCLEVLRYLNRNIRSVNKLGIGVIIEKIDGNEELIEILRKRGITRLPVLLSPDGNNAIGMRQVIDLFEKGIKRIPGRARSGAEANDEYDSSNTDFGTNPDLANFWERELYSGRDNKGKMRPRDDPDEEITGEGGDLEKKLTRYYMNTPKHRRPNYQEPDDDPDPYQPAERPRRTAARQRRDVLPVDEPMDNIEPDDRRSVDTHAPPKLSSTGDDAGDSMDQRMMTAWLNNNPTD